MKNIQNKCFLWGYLPKSLVTLNPFVARLAAGVTTSLHDSLVRADRTNVT